jgi:hypothetical protein
MELGHSRATISICGRDAFGRSDSFSCSFMAVVRPIMPALESC